VNFIRDAIEGFLMQKTTFPIEILIHDDASTDGTENIIREYEAKFPDIIKPIYEKENQWVKGRRGSAVFNFPRARGKYIALCEGDDYWTDQYKLQKQVDFLEENNEYGLVSTAINCVDENNNLLECANYVIDDKIFDDSAILLWNLLEKNFIYTLTVCARTNLIREIIETYKIEQNNIYDYWIWLNISVKSMIKVFNQKTASYRIHNNSISRKESFFEIRRDLAKYYIINNYIQYKTLTNLQKDQTIGYLKKIISNNSIKLYIRLKSILLIIRIYRKNTKLKILEK
jgi:glycosyltransferase involved in cell wall biosynthesis